MQMKTSSKGDKLVVVSSFNSEALTTLKITFLWTFNFYSYEDYPKSHKYCINMQGHVQPKDHM